MKNNLKLLISVMIIANLGCFQEKAQNKTEKFLFTKYLLENFGTNSLIVYKGKFHDTVKEYYLDKPSFQSRVLKRSSPTLFSDAKYNNSFIDSLISGLIIFDLDTNIYIVCGTELKLDSTSKKIFNFTEGEILKYYFEGNIFKINSKMDRKPILTEGKNSELTRGEHDALIKFLYEHQYFVDEGGYEGLLTITKFDSNNYKIPD